MAVEFAVAKSIITVWLLGTDKLSENTNPVVPEFPSTTEGSLIESEGNGFTLVVVVAVLFPRLGSTSFPKTLTVSVILAVERGLTTKLIAAPVPAARLPILQVKIPPDWEQMPEVDMAETKTASAGNGFVTLTPVAAPGPLLVTVME